MSDPHFHRIATVGIGLIGSSLARAIAAEKLSNEIAIFDASAEALAAAAELKLGQVSETLAGAVMQADLVIVATPIGAYADLGPALAPLRPRL